MGRRTEFFAILGHFLPYDPPNPKNPNFEKMRKLLEISFYTCAPQMTITWCTVSKISSTTDIIFCHFGNPGNQNFEMKKRPGDITPMCTINENHMMHGSWDMVHDTEFFLILDHWRYHHFSRVYQKSLSFALLFLRYGVWLM